MLLEDRQRAHASPMLMAPRRAAVLGPAGRDGAAAGRSAERGGGLSDKGWKFKIKVVVIICIDYTVKQFKIIGI